MTDATMRALRAQAAADYRQDDRLWITCGLAVVLASAALVAAAVQALAPVVMAAAPWGLR
jgi:hypothetical protein